MELLIKSEITVTY